MVGRGYRSVRSRRIPASSALSIGWCRDTSVGSARPQTLAWDQCSRAAAATDALALTRKLCCASSADCLRAGRAHNGLREKERQFVGDAMGYQRASNLEIRQRGQKPARNDVCKPRTPCDSRAAFRTRASTRRPCWTACKAGRNSVRARHGGIGGGSVAACWQTPVRHGPLPIEHSHTPQKTERDSCSRGSRVALPSVRNAS